MIGPAVKGQCPSLLAPMASGDGLLVRVKPRAATLTAGQAEAVARAVRRCGNGLIEPTVRGHLQVRGLSDGTVDGFAAAMAGIGLAAETPRAEAVRNVLADPLGPDDPAAPFDSHALARRLSAMLETDPALHALPDKFGLLVDAGVALPLAGCSADMMVRAGGTGATVALAGGDRLLGLPENAVEEAVRRLLTAFLAWKKGREDGEASSAPERMKAMVADCGADGVFDAAAVPGPRRPVAETETAADRPPVGFAPIARETRGYLSVGAPFGSLEASALAALAALSRQHGDGTIRVTPWKSLVLWGVSQSDVADLRAAASEFGLVVEPDDPRSRIVACAGRPRCASGHADTRADAAVLTAAGLPRTGLLHLSGCTKGCAHPAPTAATLVATPGGYDLVRDGRACDPPAFRGLTRNEATRILAKLEAPVSDSLGFASGWRAIR